MNASGPLDRGRNATEPTIEAAMRYHRRSWRMERACWSIIALLLVAAVLGLFGDGPVSHARSDPSQPLSVGYERLLRASAPTQYRFSVDPAMAVNGVLVLRIDSSLVDLMQVDSITPQPEGQVAGDGYTEFLFRIKPAAAPASVVFAFRPATFGRHAGQVTSPGAAPIPIQHFIYP